MKGTLKITTPTDREVVVTRAFDAPAALVFDALTKPEILKKWYGQEGWEMVVCDVDLRVGGAWRFVSRLPGGKEIGQLGVYREIVPGRRLVNTENWEDWDAGECLVTIDLEESDGKTRLTSAILFPSREVRDIVLKSGLESSAGAVYDRLSEVLEVEKVKESLGSSREAV
jgi:uncharacterized protein YndB with AHSA1/START domain